jgi:AraC-like DNA-binding protein
MPITFAFIGLHRNARPVARHSHPHHELILPLQGSCRVAIANDDHLLAPLDGLFIPAGTLHDQRPGQAGENHYIKFLDDAAPDQPGRIRCDDDLSLRWCSDLHHLQGQGELQACSALLRLLLERLRRQGDRQRRQADLPPALSRALDWIEGHFQEAVGIEDIAAAAGISSSHLNLLCRLHGGRSPGTRLLARRMEQARLLLHDDYRSIAEVAALSGLPDANYFARRFHAEHGCSPREWRRRLAADRRG